MNLRQQTQAQGAGSGPASPRPCIPVGALKMAGLVLATEAAAMNSPILSVGRAREYSSCHYKPGNLDGAMPRKGCDLEATGMMWLEAPSSHYPPRWRRSLPRCPDAHRAHLLSPLPLHENAVFGVVSLFTLQMSYIVMKTNLGNIDKQKDKMKINKFLIFQRAS